MGNKLRVKKMIQENIVLDAKYIYRLIAKEKINDNELVLIILELMNDNLIENNNLLTLINLLKITINNDNLTNKTKDTIYEQINKLLKKDCQKDIHLLLENLKSYISCLFNLNIEEQQLRNFYEQELEKNKRTIANLQKVINKRETRIKELEKANKNKDKKINERKKALQEKEKQLNKLKAKSFSYSEDNILSLAEIEKIKKYLLINLEEPKTKEELLSLAKDINLNEQQFNKIFNELLNEYNLRSNIANFPNFYQLMPLEASSKQTIYYPTTKNELDMIMIGDLHIRNVSNYFRSLMYSLNNYAIKNNISLACILGDIYDIRWEDLDKVKYEFMKKWEKLAFELKKELDKSELNYLILGGNHDERALKSGIDLINFLDQNCDKAKSIGYTTASIVFGEVKKNNNNIGLHHTGRKIILPKPVYIGEYENTLIKKYLNDYYLNNYKSYFDVFGHFHFDYLNINEGYQLIPNFINDSYHVKAYHLKLHFNEKRTIDYIELKPLEIYDNELLAKNEIIYKKTRKL